MSEISIIIPVYNVERYLPECLDSLLCQTFRDIEIICVDDASTDRSPEILREYEVRDSRIRVHQMKVNSRQGAARNFGLKIARAPYIGFVDADDIVMPHHFERLYQAITLHKADMVITPFQFFDQRESVKRIFLRIFSRSTTEEQRCLQKWEHVLGNEWQQQQDFSNPVKRALCADMFMQVMSKLYTSALLDDLFFPEGVQFEDIPFTVEASKRAKKIVSIPDGGYCYRRHRASTTLAPNPSKYFDLLAVLHLTQSYVDSAEMLPEEETVYQGLIKSRYQQSIRALCRTFYWPTPDKIYKIWIAIPPTLHGYLIKRLLRRYLLLTAKTCGPIIIICFMLIWIFR
jgi:glycosyltransferase involved in cell wall biosynthesis